MKTYHLTGIIQREGDCYVAHCLEVDVVSQGDSVEQARGNLREALELFFECASPEEISSRLQGSLEPQECPNDRSSLDSLAESLSYFTMMPHPTMAGSAQTEVYATRLEVSVG